MKTLVITAAAILLMALPARADEAARQVISDQIAALQQDDFETAFTFASPTIRRIFGGPDQFGQMVQNGYPMVLRPAEIRFLGSEQTNMGLRQGVMIRDLQGVLHQLDYAMVPGPDGWKIDGVRIRAMPDGSA
mgnify:CR=1 FL=1